MYHGRTMRLREVLDRLRHPGLPLPPRHLMFVGRGQFFKTGNEFLRHFIEVGGLRPNESVLDVGCGVGRMALPLTLYLDPAGSYDGFDIVRGGIEWCAKNVTAAHPNFKFHHADIFNGRYNPSGKGTDSEYTFPWPRDRFDFCFATSVFTHMLPGGFERYVSEIGRVLRTGGRCLLTFFLVQDESLMLIQEGKAAPALPCDCGTHRTMGTDRPEDAVGYSEDYVRAVMHRAGLVVREPIRYGSWCGRRRFLSYQDILVGEKAGA